MTEDKKPIIDLERECQTARKNDLIEEYVYCPTSSQPYMLIRFYESTSKAVMQKIVSYITLNYDIEYSELNLDDKTLYICYNFWKRFSSE